MPFYEVIFETGRTGVAFAETDEEVLRAHQEHHERAIRGEPGGPVGAPAERVKRILKYDVHPNEYNPSDTMSADVLKKELDAVVDKLADENGVVSVGQLAVEVRGLTHPHVNERGSFDSQFKMKEASELKLPWAGKD